MKLTDELNTEKNKIKKLTDELYNEKDKIKKLTDELNNEKDKNKKFSNESNKYENQNIILNQKVKDLQIVINNNILEIENLKRENIDLNKEINNINNQKMNLYSEIVNLNTQINKLKMNKNTNLDFIKPEILCIQFISIDEIVDFAIPCKNTDIFGHLEEQLYKHYPDYKGTNNYFTCNGNVIDRFKTLEENKIRNSDKILLNRV